MTEVHREAAFSSIKKLPNAYIKYNTFTTMHKEQGFFVLYEMADKIVLYKMANKTGYFLMQICPPQ